MSDDARKGRCLCGAVRFEAQGAPRFISNCHCETCRRASSAPSVTWAGFTDAQVAISGETLTGYASSPGVTRYFCSRCGSPIAFRGARWGWRNASSGMRFRFAGDDGPDRLSL